MDEIKLILGDCLVEMPKIADKSIDMILCDLPYGTTACKWDTIIPFEPLWKEYKRIIKDNGAIVLTAKQPFTSNLLLSNINMFRYELIWQKDKGTDFGNSNIKPLNAHENILIFYSKSPIYNKQMEIGKPYTKKNYRNNGNDDLNFKSDNSGVWINNGERTPISVIKISRDNISRGTSIHPTQKPVALFEYLIKTYTNEGDLVLDNCAGSGTTGVACKNLNRNCILIEKDEEYFKIAERRINQTSENLL
jgi:site-specific DNA-methyltransferase (adenine-specific)